jgi:hypothetical protein
VAEGSGAVGASRVQRSFAVGLDSFGQLAGGFAVGSFHLLMVGI